MLAVLRGSHGEGGLIAILAAAAPSATSQPLHRSLMTGGLFRHHPVFYGDGVIPPAISRCWQCRRSRAGSRRAACTGWSHSADADRSPGFIRVSAPRGISQAIPGRSLVGFAVWAASGCRASDNPRRAGGTQVGSRLTFFNAPAAGRLHRASAQVVLVLPAARGAANADPQALRQGRQSASPGMRPVKCGADDHTSGRGAMLADPARDRNPFCLVAQRERCRWCSWPPQPRDRVGLISAAALSVVASRRSGSACCRARQHTSVRDAGGSTCPS